MKSLHLRLGAELEADRGVFADVPDGAPEGKQFQRIHKDSRLIEEVSRQTGRAQNGGGGDSRFLEFDAQTIRNPELFGHEVLVSTYGARNVRSGRHGERRALLTTLVNSGRRRHADRAKVPAGCATLPAHSTAFRLAHSAVILAPSAGRRVSNMANLEPSKGHERHPALL